MFNLCHQVLVKIIFYQKVKNLMTVLFSIHFERYHLLPTTIPILSENSAKTYQIFNE